MKALKRFWWWLFELGWRVVYRGGQVSVSMSYCAAKDYAAIFDGKAVPEYEVKDELR